MDDCVVDGKLNRSANRPETETYTTMSANKVNSEHEQSKETLDKATTGEVESEAINDDAKKDEEAHPFSHKTWKEDLTLVVEGRNMYVSKAILGMYSPVFNEMFEEGPVDTMHLHNKTHGSVLEFLCCLYPNIRKPVTIQNLHLVMALALEYQIACLTTECKRVITNNATQATPCHVLLHLIQLCQTLKLKTLEDLCWKGVSGKDVGGIEEMEGLCKDMENKLKLCKIKSDKLKRSVLVYTSKTSKLQKEMDSLDGILLFLMGNMSWTEKQEVINVKGGDFGTIHVKYTAFSSEIKLTEQSNDEYGISLTSFSSNLYVSFRATKYYTTVKGRLTIENRVSPGSSRSFPLFVQFSEHKQCFEIKTLRLSDITNVAKGFLIQSEGAMKFEYISKRQCVKT